MYMLSTDSENERQSLANPLHGSNTDMQVWSQRTRYVYTAPSFGFLLWIESNNFESPGAVMLTPSKIPQVCVGDKLDVT